MFAQCSACTVEKQGDQMSSWKIRPKCSPIHFLSLLMHNVICGKEWPKMWAAFAVARQLLKVGKQSHNGWNFARSGHTVTSLEKPRNCFSVSSTPCRGQFQNFLLLPAAAARVPPKTLVGSGATLQCRNPSYRIEKCRQNWTKCRILLAHSDSPKKALGQHQLLWVGLL
jgi:hypothetical protein